MAAIATDAQTICNMPAAGFMACKPVCDTSKPNPADCNVLPGSCACRYAIRTLNTMYNCDPVNVKSKKLEHRLSKMLSVNNRSLNKDTFNTQQNCIS
ncbi:hypothetical protein Patl1_14556 [Pistacia atlantica]|uniref:Uncharacterized protein n=1 Tax=Pistacia atlantica TaxID=434234 RepID=A0ACC1AWR8_9ROSI|nr:hypothetical protein Patl1_14556 [Pistacia atlantica]